MRFTTRLLLHVFLVLIAIVSLLPLMWTLSYSFKDVTQFYEIPPRFLPRPFYFENYRIAVQEVPFFRYVYNTLTVTFFGLIGILLTATLVGYAFARLRYPGRDMMFKICLSTLMLPYAVTIIPNYILFKYLGWINTYLPLVVPSWFGGGAFNIFLARQFFATIPYDLDEAARVDGANALWIWLRIILPLSRPLLATMTIFGFLHYWGDFLGPLIYLHSQSKFTLALGISAFADLTGSWGIGPLMAASVITLIPVIVVFVTFQRYFVRGIVTTGLSGR